MGMASHYLRSRGAPPEKRPHTGRRDGKIIHRRSVRGGLTLLLGTSLLIACDAGEAVRQGRPEGTTSRPNVLIIVTDDQRSDGTLAVMPSTRRWFVRGGVTFTRAYATTPLCCPSRASVFTGRYAHNHRVRNNGASLRLDQSTTIQHALQGAGYLTGIVGKYLNGWPLQRNPPFFDRWAVFRHGYFNVQSNLNGSLRQVPGYATDALSRMAGSFLRRAEQRDERPWYLYVAPPAPHPPFQPEASYRKAKVPPERLDRAMQEKKVGDKPSFLREREVGDDVPPYLRPPGRLRAKAATIRRLQLRTLMSVDDLVERLMNDLGALGERDETLAFFTSDNGYLWGEHRSLSKRLPYTPSLQVPFLARFPPRLEGGTESDRPTLNIDIAPTVADAAGLPASAEGMDGVSIFDRAERPQLLFEHWGSQKRGHVPTWFSVRSDAYQFVRYQTSRGQVREYYDLKTDPWQLHNLLGDADPSNDPAPAHIRRLDKLLSRLKECRGASCP